MFSTSRSALGRGKPAGISANNQSISHLGQMWSENLQNFKSQREKSVEKGKAGISELKAINHPPALNLGKKSKNFSRVGATQGCATRSISYKPNFLDEKMKY